MFLGDTLISTWLELLTLEEKVSLLGGLNMWETVPIARLGIPSLKTTDGPAGVRGQTWFGGSKSTFIPCGISLGATFDPDLIEKVGEILGKETKAKNAHILLAPTMNLSRSPFGGRNFENNGEDPYLTGRIATSEVRGIQSQGVGACMKHYVANEQESRRFNIDEQIDERTLREMYLRPFQMAMKANPWSVMSSYNKVNGEHVDGSHFLLKQILRDEWGFDGLTMSDWGGTNSVVESVLAGLDLEMPGPPVKRGSLLLSAVSESKITESSIDECVKNILKVVCKAQGPVNLSKIVGQKGITLEGIAPAAKTNIDRNGTAREQTLDLLEHRQIIKDAAIGGMVLLKNNGILPLQPSQVKKVAIIGPNAKKPTAGGSGSAALNPYYISTPYESIAEGIHSINPEVLLTYGKGILTHRLMPLLENVISPDNGKQEFHLGFFRGFDLGGEIVETKSWGSSFIFFMSDDDVPQALKGKDYSIRLSGIYKPPVTGVYQFGLSSIGKAKFFIDDILTIDNSNWTKAGGTMMNCGSEEVVVEIFLDCAKSYNIRIDYAATRPPFKAHDNTLFPFLAGIRLGALPPVDEDELFTEAVQLAKEADQVVYIGGLNNDWEKEGSDRTTLQLPRRSEELIHAVLAANPNTVIVNQSACPVDMSSWVHKAAAVVQAWYQGQECGNAIADVLLGKANPSGKLPITLPRKIEDHGSSEYFPGDVENDSAAYGEGLFVGYRWFDKHGIDPLFEFGYGLTYTTFAISNISIDGSIGKDKAATLIADVTNTGDMTGSEVVQVYLSVPDISAPVKALKGFQKVHVNPKETRRVRIELDKQAIEWYDVEQGQWRVDNGSYDVYVGSSSRDIKSILKLPVKM